MPTVLRFERFRVVIYPADHVPSHVHVIGGGGEAVFNLDCPGKAVELRENYGMPRRSVARVRAILIEDITHLCAEWRRIHGQA